MAIKRTRSEVDVRRFGHVRVWRDDLEAIVRTVAEVADDIELSTPEFSFDCVEDLATIREPKIDKFQLSANQGRINIELGPSTSRIIISEPDLKARGMATEVERILHARRRPFRQRRNLIAAAAALILGTVVGTLAWQSRSFADATPLVIAAIAALSLIPTMAAANVLDNKLGSAIIYTRTHQDAPPWFMRNKDALATNAIVSLIFLILGIVVGYILPK